MRKKFDVAVLGGGVVGHTLALLLARERLKVALVQGPKAPLTGSAASAGSAAPTRTATHTATHSATGTSSETSNDIRAYALNAASRALLQELRVWPDSGPSDSAAVTEVRQMQISEPYAEPPASLTFGSADAAAGTGALAWIVDVPALENTLAQAVRFQSGIELVEPDAAADIKAALTVICEGKRSSHRDALGFGHVRHPYPHTAVAARLDCELPHGGTARQWFLDGEVLALLPMNGAAGRQVALVWSAEHSRAAELLALDGAAFAEAVQAACGSALGAMRSVGATAGWPLELSRAEHWVQAGWALAGDAAHAIHPLAGQGLNVGLADVAELVRVLREREYWRDLGDLRLLRRYERARKADVAAMSLVTDGLFGLFGHSDTRIQALRQWGLRNFDRLTPLKRWAAQQAMGRAAA
jgi:ubiquinone biosynthesis UbiH/UbiF/VisC/COQ6 family hydroxylase